MTSNNVKLSEIIAPSFHDPYKQLKTHNILEAWFKGGRGSTKSSFISIYIMLMLSKDENANAFVSRRYDNELRDSVFGQMQWACNKLQIDHIWRFMVSPMQAVNIKTGQKIIFRGIDNPLKAKSINLGKGYFKVFWAEEVDQYGSLDEIRNILQSVFRGEGTGQIAFYSFNPPKSMRSWVNQEVKVQREGRLIHHSDYRDVNPDWLGQRFIVDAEHLKDVNFTAYEHEYLGKEVGTGLEVFNNLDVRTITDEEINSFGQKSQGLDFGYAVDPLSFVRMYYLRKKRTLYIFREISGIGLSNRMFSTKLTQEEKRQLTYADCAEPKSIDELRRDYGVNVVGCKKGPGSVEHGVKWLQDLEKIVIDPHRCPLAAKEFMNYCLLTNRSGEVISKYPDKDNHSIDASRYGLQDDIGSLGSMSTPTVSIY